MGKTINLSIEKAKISNCANNYGTSGYGGDGIGSYVVGFEEGRKRLMRYSFTTPIQTKETQNGTESINIITSLKLDHLLFSGNFSKGPSDGLSFGTVAENIYGVLSTDINYYKGENDKFTAKTPNCFKINYNSDEGNFYAQNVNIVLETGLTYYLYVYCSLSQFGYIWFGGESVHTAEFSLLYETYTNCSAPTSLIAPEMVRLNKVFAFSWSGQAQGNSNPIASYNLKFYKNEETNSFATISEVTNNSYSFYCKDYNNLSYNDRIYCQIQSVGAQPDFSSDYSIKFPVSRINNLPDKPTIKINGEYKTQEGRVILPSTVKTVSFSTSPGMDLDQIENRQQTSIHYYSSSTGVWKRYSSGSIIQIVEDEESIRFATYDGLEYSTETIDFTFKQNIKPIISSVTIESTIPNMSPKIMVNTTSTGTQYRYQIQLSNDEIWYDIVSQTDKNIFEVSDVSSYIQNSSLPDSYKIRATYYDGIEWSDWRNSDQKKLYGLTPKITNFGTCGKQIKLEFDADQLNGYNYILVDGTSYKINNNAAIIVLKDNLTDSKQEKSFTLYAGVTNNLFHNVKKSIICNQVCSLQVSRINLPFNNGIVKPYTNTGSDYVIDFLGLNENNFDQYFKDGVFTSFALSFSRPDNVQQSKKLIISIADCIWSNNSLKFSISAEDLCNNLMQLFQNRDTTYDVICSFETDNGYSDIYTFSQGFIADFREIPSLKGTHIYADGYPAYGLQYWAYLKEGMPLILNIPIATYNKINGELKIIIKGQQKTYIEKVIDIQSNETEDSESNFGYGNPYKYFWSGGLWQISNITNDDILTFEAKVVTNVGENKIQIIDNISLKTHPTPQLSFTQIQYDGANLNFIIRAEGNGATINIENFPSVYSEKGEIKITSGSWEGNVFRGEVIGFDFETYNLLHMAPIGSSIFSTYLKDKPGEYIDEFSTEKTNEGAYNYSTVYNILPTIAYRKNQVGINLQPNTTRDNKAAVVIGSYGEKDCIYFYGDSSKASLNLSTHQLDNFIVDCGSWAP